MGSSTDEPTARDVIAVGDNHLHIAVWGKGTPSIILLHEGLGSIAGWKRVPSLVSASTGETVLAFDRAGHGASTPHPDGPWPTRWLHDEAEVLAGLVATCAVAEPLLVGHSDGGSIALIAAAEGHCTPRGILTLAAHSWVEQLCIDSIVAMRSNADAFVARLARTHAFPGRLFEAWSGVWVSEPFSHWDIRAQLHSISCPVLVAQGSNDEYASQQHAHLTAAAVGATATSQLMPGLGHLIHHQDPNAVVDIVTDFAVATKIASEQDHQ